MRADKKKKAKKGDKALSRQEKEARSAKFEAKKEGQATTAEIVLEINKLWEKLRSKHNTDEESEELSEKVYEIVQGRVFEMALKHDASRAIQAVFQRGTKTHRSAMIAELKPTMAAAGAIPPLVAMLTFEAAEAREYAAAVVSALARTQGGNKKAIYHAGGIRPLTALLSDARAVRTSP